MEYCASSLAAHSDADSQKLSGFVYENISDDEEVETKPFHAIGMAKNELGAPLDIRMNTGLENTAPLDLSYCNINTAQPANSNHLASVPVYILKKEFDCDMNSANTESIIPMDSDADNASTYSLSLQTVGGVTESPNSYLSEEASGDTSPVIQVCGEINCPVRKKRRRKNKTHARVTPKKSKKKKVQEAFLFEIANDTAELYSFKSEDVFDGAYASKTGEAGVARSAVEMNQNIFNAQSTNIENLGTNMDSNNSLPILPFEIALTPTQKRKSGRPKKLLSVTATATSSRTSSTSEDFEDSYTKMTAEEQQQIIGFRIAEVDSSETAPTANTQFPSEHLNLSQKKRKKGIVSKKSTCTPKQVKIEHDASLSIDDMQENYLPSSQTKISPKRGRPKHSKSKLKSTRKGSAQRKGRPPCIGQFKCDRCELIFKERPKLQQHRKTHVKPFIYCSYCDFKARSRGAFLEHESRHTKEKPFKCELCSYASRSRIDLRRHQSKHSKVKNYKCPYCDFTTKWQRNVSSHLLSHVEDRPFHCEICGHSFKRPCDLKYHLYRHTSLKPLKCKECGFRCKTNYELNLHQFKHSDVRPFPCTHPGCQQACKTKSDLNKHMHVHSEERKYPCPLCGKCFKSPSARNKHTQRHTNERPFTCHICNKSFKVKSSLGKHLQLHSGIRPFSCDVCDRTFANKSNKRAHMKTHELTDRPYRCPLCPYGGKSQQNLLAHVGTMHGNYAFFCELCKRPYKRHRQLQLHYNRMHTTTELEKLKNLDSLDMTLIKGEEDESQSLSQDEGDEGSSAYQLGFNRILKQIKQEGSIDADSATTPSHVKILKQEFVTTEKRKRGRPRKKVKLSPCKKSGRKNNMDCENTEDSGDGEPKVSKSGQTKPEHDEEKQSRNLSGHTNKENQKCESQQSNQSGHTAENSQSKLSKDTSGIEQLADSSQNEDSTNTSQIEPPDDTSQTNHSAGTCQVGHSVDNITTEDSANNSHVEHSVDPDTSENLKNSSLSKSHTDDGSDLQLEDDGLVRFLGENSSEVNSFDASHDSHYNGPSGQSVDNSPSSNSSSNGCCENSGPIKNLKDQSTDNGPSGQSVNASTCKISTDIASGNPTDINTSGCCTDNGLIKNLEDKVMSRNLSDNGPDHLVETSASDFSTDISQRRQSSDNIQNTCSISNSPSGHSADQTLCEKFEDDRTSEDFAVNDDNVCSVDTGPSGLSTQSRPDKFCKDNGSSSHLKDNSIGGHPTERSVDTCTSQHSSDQGPSGHSTATVREEDNVKNSLNESKADISTRETTEDSNDNLSKQNQECESEIPCLKDKDLYERINTRSNLSDIGMLETHTVEESNALASDVDKNTQRDDNEIKTNVQTNFEEINDITVHRKTLDVDDSISVANLHDSEQMKSKSSVLQETRQDTNCNSLNKNDTKHLLHSTETTCRNGLRKNKEEGVEPMENPDFTAVCTVQDSEDRQKQDITDESDTNNLESQVSHNVVSISERGSSVSSEICPLQDEQAVDNNKLESDSSKSKTCSPIGDHESCSKAEQTNMKKKSFVKNTNSHSTWTKFDDNFRLPLAKKGFHFNFRKTGKKPKCWFMELDVMDEEAKNLQLQYLCRKDRLGSSVQAQGKKRQVSVSKQMTRKRNKLISASRMKCNKGSESHFKQHGKGPTLTNISKDFVKKWQDTIGSSSNAPISSMNRAHRSYTSRLDGEKVSKEDLLKLNKSEGTMMKPKLSIVSDEVSESCMQKVRGVSMTTRSLPFKKKYIKLEIDEEGRCINPEDNCPIKKATDTDAAGKIDNRKEIKLKIVTNPDSDKEAIHTETNKNVYSETEANKGVTENQEKLSEKDAGEGQVLQTDAEIHRKGQRQRVMQKKATCKRRAVKSGLKQAELRKESDCSDDRSNICEDSPKPKPKIADFKMETEKSVKLKLQEKINKRKVDFKTNPNTYMCSMDTDGQMVMTLVDENERQKAKRRKSRQCSVCMRDILFGKEDSDKNLDNMTCPSCELDCQLSSEFKANQTENRYEKIDLGSDNEDSDEDKLFSKNVYVVMPPADKTLVQKDAKPTRVYCKPSTGHIKTYVVSKEMNKEASYELTDVRENREKNTGRATETMEKEASPNQTQTEFVTEEVNDLEVQQTIPDKGSPELEEPVEIKPNIESLDFQVHVNSKDNSMIEMETAPQDSSNFEIGIDYTQVKEENEIQCNEEDRNGFCKTAVNNQPFHSHTTSASISNFSVETSSEVTTTNIKHSENLSYAYLCTGMPSEDANSNNNNINTSDASVSQVRIKTSISKEDISEGSEQESDTKIYVYCDDVAAMRLLTGKKDQGQSAKVMLWNDPCVKTVVEDLGNDTRFINGQVENISTATYLGHKVKIEKDENLDNEIPDLVDDPVMQSFSRDTSVINNVMDNTATNFTEGVSTDIKPLPIYHLSENDMKYHVQETQNQSSEPNMISDNTNVAEEEPGQCLPIILDVRSIKQEPDFDSFV